MNARLNLDLIERIAAELLPYRDDEDVFIDTLDGETDAIAILDREIAAEQFDRAMVDAIEQQVATLKVRHDRIEARAQARRTVQRMILQAMDMRKVERPLATLSLVSGRVSVRITDEAAIPTQLLTVKTVTAPDKAAIKAQIEAGETVPGAELVRGDETLSVRVK